MPQITEQDFSDPSTTLSLLEKGLHGGFLSEDSLTEEETELCKQKEWIERVNKYKCSSCGTWHKAPPGEERCLRTQEPIEPRKIQLGFRVIADESLDFDLDIDYELFVEEASSAVDTATLPYKSIVFLPDTNDIVFSDRAGSTVFLPLDVLASFTDGKSRNEILSEITEKRKRLVDWERLDDGGGDFEEIIFRLVSRDDNYFNESWGGSGPDQGKDGFCSINLGGRETRVLVQAKFNNNGKAENSDQVEKSCRKAERHDCRGVIIGTVKTSGDLESEFDSGALHTRSVNYLRIWAGPEIKEKLSKHPDIVAEYFLE